MNGKGEQFNTDQSPLSSQLRVPQLVGELTRHDSKDKWRSAVLGERATVSSATASDESGALAEHVVRAFARIAAESPAGSMIAAYVPALSEPGSIAMLDGLAACRARVLLPVTAPGNTLDWALYDPDQPLVAARYGLQEPGGTRLGMDALSEAELIIVPALAVDRRGVRLGRGAGYYDRALAVSPVHCPVIAIVRDSEFVTELPESPHDRRVSGVITPELGLVRLD